MRWDDTFVPMSSGPRSGQYVMQSVRTRLAARGITFTQARADDATCAPGRGSLHTGMYSRNHGIGPDNSTDDYYDFYRQGKKQAAAGSGTSARAARWIGPWEFDCAKRAGLAETPVSPAAQASTLGTCGTRTVTGHGIARGNSTNLQPAETTTPDDLQAFTGSLANWLSENGVRCGLVGKYQNAYADTTDNRYTTAASQYLFVPPGWNYWAALVGDDSSYNGGAQDHWRVHTCEYQGTNPGDGTGATGTEVAYRYDLPITSITWASGTATVTVDSTLSRPHNLQIGDEVHVEGVTPTGFCSTVGAAGFTVTGIPSAYSFEYAISNPGASSGSTAVGAVMVAYPRPNYGDSVWARKAIEFVNSCRDDEPWYLYLSPDNPHQGTIGGDTPSDARERERRYVDTVDRDGYAYWAGTYGAISPATIAANLTTERRRQWQQRQEMLASTSDAIDDVLDAVEARGWTNVIVVFTSDNGFQVGEQEAREGAVVWDSLGGKGFVWDGSVRLPFIIRHPRWARNVTTPQLVCHADVPLTVLDWFGLTSHHAHTKRDGYSIQRLLADRTDPVNGRAQLVTRGDYYQGRAQAIIDSSLKKLVRVEANNSLRQLFDRSTDTDYEMTDIASTNSAKVTELAGRLDNLRDCRWNGTTNTCRTA